MGLPVTTYADAFWMSSGEDDDSAKTSGELHRLGLIVDDKEIIEYQPGYANTSYQQMGLFYFKNTKGNYDLKDIAANYKLTNGTIFHGMLGQKMSESTGVSRTLSHLDINYDIGEKPRYNLLTHTGDVKKQLFGCVMKEASLSWEGNRGYVLAQTKYDALSWASSTWATSEGLYHPGGVVASEGEFKPFSIPQVLTWDSSGDGGQNMGDFTAAVNVSLQMTQKLIVTPGTGAKVGMNEEINDSLAVGSIFTVGYWGNESVLEEDHEDENLGTLTWRMGKPDPAERDIYYEVTATNCSVLEPAPFRENGKTVAYGTMIKPEKLSVFVKDHINDYFYKYPAT